jgi:hypothetical protein
LIFWFFVALLCSCGWFGLVGYDLLGEGDYGGLVERPFHPEGKRSAPCVYFLLFVLGMSDRIVFIVYNPSLFVLTKGRAPTAFKRKDNGHMGFGTQDVKKHVRP